MAAFAGPPTRAHGRVVFALPDGSRPVIGIEIPTRHGIKQVQLEILYAPLAQICTIDSANEEVRRTNAE